LGAERNERELGQLKVLHAERDAYDCHAHDQPEAEVRDAQFDAAADYPQDVAERAHYAEAAQRGVAPERPQDKPGDLEALHAKRNAYYRDADDQSDDRPHQRRDDSPAHQP